MALNTRQWDLYNYLKAHYSEDHYISKMEIANEFPQYYEIKENELKGGRGICREIEVDVRIINQDLNIQKIIVSSKDGYKIGNPEQVHDYVYRGIEEAKNKLKLMYLLKRKASYNGQYLLRFGVSKARDHIEAYMEQQIEKEIKQTKEIKHND